MKSNVFKTAVICIALFSAFLASAQKNATKETTTDIVCGMPVDKSESFDFKYKGVKYYFDSFDCREAFKKDPESFLNKKCVMNDNLIDPVCGVKVNIFESYDYKYQGHVFHFHSIACKESFKMNPEKFKKNFCAPKDSVK